MQPRAFWGAFRERCRVVGGAFLVPLLKHVRFTGSNNPLGPDPGYDRGERGWSPHEEVVVEQDRRRLPYLPFGQWKLITDRELMRLIHRGWNTNTQQALLAEARRRGLI